MTCQMSMPSHKPDIPLQEGLYVVSLPIGCSEDMSARGISVLQRVHIILAEDTRKAMATLRPMGIATPVHAYHEHSDPAEQEALVQRMRGGRAWALITDAGTPCVADPGATLIAQVAQCGIAVRAVPGVSAVTTALMLAGMPADNYRFHGFIARKGKARERALAAIAAAGETTVFYESPRRLAHLLTDLRRVACGTRRIFIGRELTKTHEQQWRGTLAEASAVVGGDSHWQLGEVTLVLAAGTGAPRDATELHLRRDELMQAVAGLAPPRHMAKVLAPLLKIGTQEAYALLRQTHD